MRRTNSTPARLAVDLRLLDGEDSFTMLDSILKAIDALDGVALLIASIVALYGISAWKREHVGKKRIELAEEVLELFYKVREIIQDARNDLAWSDDLAPSREPQEGETAEEKRMRDYTHAYMYGYSIRQDTFSQLEAKRHRFIVYFGKSARQPFSDLSRIIGRVRTAVRILALLEGRSTTDAKTREQIDAHTQAAHEIIWDQGEDDQITTELNRIVGEIEAICRPEFERQTGRWVRSLIDRTRNKIKTKDSKK